MRVANRFCDAFQRTASVQPCRNKVRTVEAWFWLVLVLLLAGCASMKNKEVFRSAEATAELKSRLGTIGLVSAQFLPRAELIYIEPAGGGTMVHSTANPGIPMTERYNSAEAPERRLAKLILSPLVIVPGSEKNGSHFGRDHPEQEVSERDALIAKGLAELNIQEKPKEWFFKSARVKTPFNFELVKAGGPPSEGDHPDYRSQKELGMDTIQEMSITRFGWKTEGGTSPVLALFMELKVRLVRTLLNEEFFERNYQCESAGRKTPEWWGARDSHLDLKQEFDNCYRMLSEKVIRDIYLLDTYIP